MTLNKCSCGTIPVLEYDEPFNYVICPRCGKMSMTYIDSERERDGANNAVKNWNTANAAVNLEAVKDKAGKPRMSLLLPKAAEALVRVREYGLRKYPDADNWKRVPREDWLDAALRHLMRYLAGEKNDAESGLPHLWHVLCNISYMIEGE